ncbi:MAG TPA: CBS domain-containing protein [Acidimicrobiia bacterium]|jgi:CBS domain-containing protein
MKLRDLMTRDVITIGPDASLKEAARRMIEAGVSGLPVTEGDDDRLVGIITEADFVATEADRRRKRRAGLLRFIYKESEIPSEARVIRDVMSTDLIVLSPEADHAEAARLMERARVKRIPVVEEGRLVGLVSRSDIIRAFARPDGEIISEIVGHLMGDVLWIDPQRVAVACRDGNVTLRGRLDTRSDAELLAKLTERVDGVASVANHLEYEVDNTKLETMPAPIGMGMPKGF